MCIKIGNKMFKLLMAMDTIGSQNNKQTNLPGNEHWKDVESIKHCEKRLPSMSGSLWERGNVMVFCSFIIL